MKLDGSSDGSRDADEWVISPLVMGCDDSIWSAADCSVTMVNSLLACALGSSDIFSSIAAVGVLLLSV